MSNFSYSDEQFIDIVKNSLSIAQVCKKLNIKPIGGNYRTIKNKIKKLNLDTSHFTGQAWNKGKKYRLFSKSISLDNILKENSPYNSYRLKQRLLDAGLKKYICECCGNEKWLDKPIKLELHHINGDCNDNRLENIQLLCPNCHAYTDNYRGKNIGKQIKKVNKEINFELLDSENIEELKENNKPKKTLEPKYCLCCGKELIGRYRRNKYCSQECAHIANGSKRPSVFDLINDFKELKSFVQVGHKYGVTDNAVKKWCKLYNILDEIKNNKI